MEMNITDRVKNCLQILSDDLSPEEQYALFLELGSKLAEENEDLGTSLGEFLWSSIISEEEEPLVESFSQMFVYVKTTIEDMTDGPFE